MRRPALLSLALLLLGSACLPDAREAAVRVEVTYTFKAGCITVLARDAESSSREASTELEVLARGPSTVTLAVFRQEDWSHKLEITTEAHEQSCAGPVVARDVSTVELRKARVEQLPVTLEATDGDNDGYVSLDDEGTDCDDTKESIHPQASELCDDQDNNCNDAVDEAFSLKGSSCGDPCPGGQYRCAADHAGVMCDAPARVPLFVDQDRDGAGKEGSASVESICPDVEIPAGRVLNTEDCDDEDPYNRRGLQEICDARDNTCDGQSDEGGICAGKGWKVVTDAAVTVDRQWKTVALGLNGYPVWVAGASGKLAVRGSASQSFVSLDGSCGNTHWLAAWVRPGDGNVFLAGDGGQVAQHNGATCSNMATTPTSGAAVTGIIGFASGPIYLVNSAGRLSTWTPGSAPVEMFNQNPESFTGIHGMESTLLLGVGGTDDGSNVPSASSYPGTGPDYVRHTLTGTPAGYLGSLRAMWMGAPGLAYAVGDGGLVMKWNGTMGWARVDPPSDNATVNFTSVVVLDPSSAYTADAGGAIRRLSSKGWSSALVYLSDQPLRDIAATSTGNIWAVGDNGKVVHFSE